MCHGKANAGFPPEVLPREDFDRAAAFAREEDREKFGHYYRPGADGKFHAGDSEWTAPRYLALRLLAESGYRDDESKSPFVAAAQLLLEEVLARDPKNAEAWNLYLANYWKFSFAAFGHWFGPTHLGSKQRELIEAAVRHCPEDATLRVWQEAANAPKGRRQESLLLEQIAPFVRPALQFQQDAR